MKANPTLPVIEVSASEIPRDPGEGEEEEDRQDDDRGDQGFRPEHRDVPAGKPTGTQAPGDVEENADQDADLRPPDELEPPPPPVIPEEGCPERLVRQEQPGEP
jgi:hypothetical protein